MLDATYCSFMALGDDRKEKKEVTLKAFSTNSTACCDIAELYMSIFSLYCCVFSVVQLLINSFLCEDVFAILGTM